MSTGSINPLSNSYLQSILGSMLQNTGLTTNNANNSASGIGSLSAMQQPDSGHLSPFAQLMSELQQLQQTDPAKYQQVTAQIATNLQSAAQTAQSEGNTTAANQLNQLATDFTNASKSGQLPNVQDLAQAIGGGHHHHHHAHAASADSDTSSSTDSTAASNTAASQMLSQLLAAFQANETQSSAPDEHYYEHADPGRDYRLERLTQCAAGRACPAPTVSGKESGRRRRNPPGALTPPTPSASAYTAGRCG